MIALISPSEYLRKLRNHTWLQYKNLRHTTLKELLHLFEIINISILLLMINWVDETSLRPNSMQSIFIYIQYIISTPPLPPHLRHSAFYQVGRKIRRRALRNYWDITKTSKEVKLICLLYKDVKKNLVSEKSEVKVRFKIYN